MTNDQIKIPAPIRQAIAAGEPVVALESTVIAHGLPRPLNLETARDCERAVTEAAALPATIGIVAGVPTAGINEAELEAFAGVVTNEHQAAQEIAKVGLNNLAG